MRIKTFEAPTMQEALALARQEFGSDAVVLNTKHVKAGGLLGLRGGTKVEVMAAIDDQPVAAQPRPAAQVANPVLPKAAATTAYAQPSTNAQSSAPAMNPFAARLYAESSNRAPQADAEIVQLRAELKNLSSTVSSLLNGSCNGMMPSAGTDEAGFRSNMLRNIENSAVTRGASLLERVGIDNDLAHGILKDLLVEESPLTLASALAAKMQAFAIPPVIDSHKVIAVVGPTGVGKTTTLAKMAAKFALEQGKSVALVTADTFRIGAVEQLRTYARIMGIPLEIALSPEEVAAGVEKHRDKDVVLVDTVGRSQRNEEHLKELKTFVDAAKPTDTYLVISASLSNDIQKEVVESFAIFSPTRLAITKLDECSKCSCLANLPLKTGLAISCTTDGQNVPQDIDFADAGRIARAIVGVA